MANNLTQIQADLKTTLGTNLDAATLTNARNYLVLAWAEDFKVYLAANRLPDTTVNRNNFIASKWLQVLKDAYQTGSDISNRVSLPAADSLQ